MTGEPLLSPEDLKPAMPSLLEALMAARMRLRREGREVDLFGLLEDLPQAVELALASELGAEARQEALRNRAWLVAHPSEAGHVEPELLAKWAADPEVRALVAKQ